MRTRRRRTAVQSLDTITVAASKTEEKAIDALAPVSVVTLEQIQGLQPNAVGHLLQRPRRRRSRNAATIPRPSSTFAACRTFGRVAVVVDGARQNYQRTGHNANGSFFLDPELVGGVDVVRGPTANIYGSGAIGGVVSFRTKDIQDVVRPGERWGVDMTGSTAPTRTAARLGVRRRARQPDVDMFGGAVYRRQGNYKDGNGTEIGKHGQRDRSRPDEADRYVRRQAMRSSLAYFPDYQYSIGQLNRGPVATAAQRALNQGSSVYASDAKNYTGTITWKYAKPDDMLWDWNATVYGNRTENDQVKTAHTTTTPSAFCGGGFGNNISGCIGDRRGLSARHCRH
jgi:hemoglobin/transferrin/lactoferrin receptor protein